MSEQQAVPTAPSVPATPAVPAPVAPVAPVNTPATPAAAPGQSWQERSAAEYAQLRDAVLSGEQPGSVGETPVGQQAPPAETPEPAADQWALDPSTVPPEPAVIDRIKERIQRRKAAQQAKPQPQSPIQPNQPPPTAQAIERYNQLMSQGKVNEALQALGSSHTLEALNAEALKAMGAIRDVQDPRVDAALAEVNRLKEEHQRQTMAAQEQRRRAEAQQIYQQDLEGVRREVVGSGLPGADKLMSLPQAAEMVLQTMALNEIGSVEAAKIVRADLLALATQFRDAGLIDSVPQALQPNGQQGAPQARPGQPAQVPSGASSAPAVPADMPYDQAWEVTRQLWIEGKL